MLWIGLANFRKHGILVQNEQGDVKLGVFHTELFTKHGNKKYLLWQSQIFTENLTIGRIEYKIAESGKGESFSPPPHTTYHPPQENYAVHRDYRAVAG